MREGRTFLTVWESIVEGMDMSVSDLTAAPELQVKMLNRFNKIYASTYSKRTWEDGWDDGALTPNGRLLPWSAVQDSRLFELWTADPRVTAGAVEAAFTTGREGITLLCDYGAVHGFWMPPVTPFTLAAYGAGTNYAVNATVLDDDGHNYLCIQAGAGHKPSESPDYWTVMPVLDVLADECAELAVCRYLIATGKFDEGNARTRIARGELDEKAATEWARLAKQQGRPWRPAY